MWKRLDHVGVRVRDLEEARRFYQQTMGLVEVDRQSIPAEGLTLVTMARGDDFRVELLYAPGREEKPGLDHLALVVEDLDQAVEEIKKAGFAEPLLIRETLVGTRICFLHGPDGERWELMERRSTR